MTSQRAIAERAPGRVRRGLRARTTGVRINLPWGLQLLRGMAILILTVWTAVVLANGPHPWVAGAVGVLAVSTLWQQQRRPLVTLAAAFGGLAVIGAIGFPGPDDPLLVLLLWASYGVGRHARRQQQPWAAAAVLFFLSINVFGEDVHLPGDIVFPMLFAAAPWILGLLVQLARKGEREARDTTVQVLQAQGAVVREATEQERLRIARELHDVAAHAMSAVSLQAQVLRRRIEAGGSANADDARQLEVAARHALDELRHVVGVLRPPVDGGPLAPQPSMDELDDLVEACRAAGQLVHVSESGRPLSIGSGLSLCAYRIVQEALANARQHGDAGPTDLAVGWTDDSMTLRIVNRLGPGVRSDRPAGHGLIGMRERVALFGGELSAGPVRGRDWVVQARLPLMPRGSS